MSHDAMPGGCFIHGTLHLDALVHEPQTAWPSESHQLQMSRCTRDEKVRKG